MFNWLIKKILFSLFSMIFVISDWAIMTYTVWRYDTPEWPCQTGWTHTQQVIVKSYGQHTNLEEAIKSSQPEFYANASLWSQIYAPNIIFLCI